MTRDLSGAGERLEQARRRRKFWIAGIGFVTGVGFGVLLAVHHMDVLANERLVLPAWLAAALIAVHLTVVIGGTYLQERQRDEFERREGYRAMLGGAYLYMIAYPVWLLLWLGQLAPEPQHALLFFSFCVGVTITYLFFKFR
jgi:hypothetical protein